MCPESLALPTTSSPASALGSCATPQEGRAQRQLAAKMEEQEAHELEQACVPFCFDAGTLCNCVNNADYGAHRFVLLPITKGGKHIAGNMARVVACAPCCVELAASQENDWIQCARRFVSLSELASAVTACASEWARGSDDAQQLQRARQAVIEIAAKAGVEGDADAVAWVVRFYHREAARNAAAREAAARPIVASEQISPP